MSEGGTGSAGTVQSETTSVDQVAAVVESPHVTLAAGVFGALGVALVLGSFMASAFATSGSTIGGTAVTVTSALTIAPLVAVLTGAWAAREEDAETGDGLRAAVGGIAGLFALYVAFIISQAALGGGTGSITTVGIGPLFGVAIGTGIAAGLSAVLVGSVEDRDQAVAVGLPWEPTTVPIGAFLAFGIGAILALFIGGELASSSNGAFAGFGPNPATGATTLLVSFAPLLALLAALLTDAGADRVGRVSAAIVGSGVGFVLSYLVVFGLAHMLESDAMDGVELAYGPIVGVAVGAALAGALGAIVAERLGEST